MEPRLLGQLCWPLLEAWGTGLEGRGSLLGQLLEAGWLEG